MRMYSLPMRQPVGDDSGTPEKLRRYALPLIEGRNPARCGGYATKIRAGGAQIVMVPTIPGE